MIMKNSGRETMTELKRETVFILLGEIPENNITVQQKGKITGQDILQDTVTDPVKGLIWDLEANRCLTHEKCTCVLEAFVKAEFFLVGNVAYLRNKIEAIKKILED